ncbi:MAG: transposase [candidate division Zixibacteria bacterium]|nr:transposase [candidate division Zixibacteria bacterium]
MGEKRRQFDRDYKLSAVRLLEQSDQPLELVARGLGISGSMLRRWREQVKMKGSDSFSELGRQDRSEILRLRRENKDLKRQIEILKKTFGFQGRAKRRNTRP